MIKAEAEVDVGHLDAGPPLHVVLGAAASIVAEMGNNCLTQLENCNTCCQPVEASLQVAAHHVLTLAKTTASRQ